MCTKETLDKIYGIKIAIAILLEISLVKSFTCPVTSLHVLKMLHDFVKIVVYLNTVHHNIRHFF